MRRRLFALLALGGLALGGIGSAQEPGRGAVVRVPVKGIIEMGLAPFVERAIAEAEAGGASAVILDIDTPGGRVDSAERIIAAVSNAGIPVYAFVDLHAYSAGAMIALSARDVYMRPGAVMGAATPVDGTGQKAPEKIVSAMRSQMRALAERRGLDPRVAEAMVDEEIAIEGVVEGGKLLTLTTSEAVRLNYAREVADWDALLQQLALADAPVLDARINWAERVVRFLTRPEVAGMLLSLGFLGLIIEIKTPSFGLAGVAGASALTAFFGSHLLLGLAGWEELILLGAGIVFLALELFVIPGFGVAGIAGILAILAAFFLSMVGSMATGADYAQALGVLSLAGIVVIVAGWALLRHLPRSRGFTKTGLMLGDATSKETGYLSAAVRTELVGSVGVALTDLRPSGAARFGQERIDVVSDSSWISAGTPVRVVRSDGYRHVVEPVVE
ncbi:MAG TPA: NfeD family protein [Longimicrobiales bacterium]